MSATPFAQNSQLFESTWYLHNLIINGENNIPPTNSEIPFVPADFLKNNEFYTGMCESGGGGQINYNGLEEFSFQSLAFLTGSCYQNEPFNEDFNLLYVYTYWLDSSSNSYTYSIVEDGSNRTLTIINSNGDEAIYGNDLLSIDEFKENIISVFPNPSNDIIHFQFKSTQELSEINIYDSTGKLIKSSNSFNSIDLSINIQELKSGIYFIIFIDDSNRKLYSKFVKK